MTLQDCYLPAVGPQEETLQVDSSLSFLLSSSCRPLHSLTRASSESEACSLGARERPGLPAEVPRLCPFCCPDLQVWLGQKAVS